MSKEEHSLDGNFLNPMAALLITIVFCAMGKAFVLLGWIESDQYFEHWQQGRVERLTASEEVNDGDMGSR